MVTILAETEVVVATLKLAPKKILISPSFKPCEIYKDELNEKVLSMVGRMNCMPGMGLGKDQSGPPKFIE